MSNSIIVDIPFGVGHVRFENLSIEQANVLSHLSNNQIKQPRVGTMLHEFKVLTPEEVMNGRSSKYDFIDFENLKKEKSLDYWKLNAEEDYMKVPISVLRYISELEKQLKIK